MGDGNFDSRDAPAILRLAVSHTLHRTIAIAVLGLCLAGATASIAKQAAAADPHACCPERSDSSATSEPCHGFLPLTCCNTSALPGCEPRVEPHVAPILALAVAIPQRATVLALRAPTRAAPGSLPARLSTILQL